MTSAPITAIIECDSEERSFIGKSPGTNAGGACAACVIGEAAADSLRESPAEQLLESPLASISVLVGPGKEAALSADRP